jgi:hypothetical protein
MAALVLAMANGFKVPPREDDFSRCDLAVLLPRGH